MPAVLPVLGWAGGIVAGTAVSGAAGAAIGPALGPFSRNGSYVANQREPNMLPSPEELIQAWATRRISVDQLTFGLWSQGLLTSTNRAPVQGISAEYRANLSALWDAVIATKLWTPEPQRVEGWWQSAQITRGDAETLLDLTGITPSGWRTILLDQFQPPALIQIIELRNRGVITDAEADDYLRRLGYRRPEERARILGLRLAIPGPSDLVMFGNRDVWEPDVVERFQYDAELPPELIYWLDKQGLGGDARTPAQIAANLPPVTWAHLYWRAGKQPISPTQAYEMLQRLRPGRVQRYWQPGFEPRAFTFQDMALLLKVADYPVPFRDQLTAIAYRNPRLVDIDRFYESGQVDKAEVQEIHLDLGYAPVDAERRTEWLTRSIDAKRKRPLVQLTRQKILTAYKVGTLTRAQAAIHLHRLYLVGRVGAENFDQLGPVQAEQEALANEVIVAALDLIDFEIQTAQIGEVIASTRRRYLRGLIDKNLAGVLLRDAGIAAPRIEQYLELWQLQLVGARQMFATSKIQKGLAEGWMPIAAAEQYLKNLGWTPADIRYLVAEARYRWSKIQTQLQARNARTARQRAQAIAATIKQAEQEARKARAELARQLSPDKIEQFAIRGILDPLTVAAALTRLGFSTPAIAARQANIADKRREYLENQVIRQRRLKDVAEKNQRELLEEAGPQAEAVELPEPTPAPARPPAPAESVLPGPEFGG